MAAAARRGDLGDRGQAALKAETKGSCPRRRAGRRAGEAAARSAEIEKSWPP